MKNMPSTKRSKNIKMIKCYGRYSGREEHGTTSVRAYIDGSSAFITHDQETRALRRIRAIVGDSLVCDDYDIYVMP